MSHGPSILGTMITSSLSPISLTSSVRSSRTHGEASSLTRVHSAVSPSSISRPTLIRPARAASLRSTGTASSRLPSRMSTVGAMSGTFATIFSLEKSRKWIIRDGLNGISRAGSGASIARGLKKSRGLRKSALQGSALEAERYRLASGGGGRTRWETRVRALRTALVAPVTTAVGTSTSSRVQVPTKPIGDVETLMSETQTVETEQAAREASGAHPYGRYLEEFEVGAVYKHWPAKTVTESDDHLFCLITMNHHPLHLNDVYAAKSQQGRNVVVGPLVYSLALGMSVSDVSGKAIANLATEELKHPAPVFHGDTLYCESEVLEKKESRSKPDRGTVRVHTRVLNQDGVLVAEFKRLVLVPRKQPGAGAGAQGSAEGNVE